MLPILTKWFTIGIGVKRWIMLLFAGMFLNALGVAFGILKLVASTREAALFFQSVGWLQVALSLASGLLLVALALFGLSNSLLAPYRSYQRGTFIDAMYTHSKRGRGLRVVAIGGGTGMPSVLRGVKTFTSNITAVVTVADDGGSSGRLRRDLGVLPPGDLRNNIAALADDESLMTQLFQYRFDRGDLGGHAFGNLFISALSGVTGSLESALIETERVLNIQGRVLPATLEEVTLEADVRLPGTDTVTHIRGESDITHAGGRIEHIAVMPEGVEAYSGAVRAILAADLITIGPGSLYTSILPNILVNGIAEALRMTDAYKVYVCNIATQPGETDGYSVADHVMTLEQHIGRGVFQAVLANDHQPTQNAGVTRYAQPPARDHEITQRYRVIQADLVDTERPWRHDPVKLARAIERLGAERQHTPRAAAVSIAPTAAPQPAP